MEPPLRRYDTRNLGTAPLYEMSIFREMIPFLKNKRKTLEVRLAYPGILRIGVGTIIHYLNTDIYRAVTRVASYPMFEDVLDTEDPDKIYPGVPPARLIELFRTLVVKNPYDERKLGLRVFELSTDLGLFIPTRGDR